MLQPPIDANGRVLDYGSIWFTTKDGTTFKIAKTQCVNYKGVSKSSSDIGASLGDPKYSKLVGLDVVKAFIDLVLWPVSSLAAKCLIYTLENLQCSLTAIFDIIRLIAAGDYNTLGQMAATVALYMVAYKLALLIVGAVIGVSSGLILAIAVAFGTAVFMLLVDLVKVGFNLNVYMEQRNLESYEDLTAYLLSQIAADVIYNFLIANFLKFAKKAKAKASPKVENIVNKVTGKVTETIDNAINKVKDTVDNIVNKVDDAINKGTNGDNISLSLIKNFIDLTDFRKDHILNRHRYGSGISGKTEFPSNWSDARILHNVSDIATDPSSIWSKGRWGEDIATGWRDGVQIQVDFYPSNSIHYGKISTAYPLSTSVNP